MREDMSSGIVIIAIVLLVVLILFYVIKSFNKLIVLRNKVKDQWAQVDVLLKRRADLIPNLVETVKGYAKHENETLEAVISARNKTVAANTPAEGMKANGELSQALSRLMVLTENYPELKANVNFSKLQATLEETEDKISYARQFYNDGVFTYKNKVEMFPSNIIASIFGFKPEPFFEAAETERTAPKVSF